MIEGALQKPLIRALARSLAPNYGALASEKCPLLSGKPARSAVGRGGDPMTHLGLAGWNYGGGEV